MSDYRLHIHHMKIQKPFVFNHGGATFHTPSPYTETESLGVTLIHDPDGHIAWENGADIQVAYATPDATWDDWKGLRVLTGRDFDLEGMAVINATYAIMGEELMPALFAINPTTGVVLTNFVRTPDIDENGTFNGLYLSSRGDKVHCEIAALENNTCLIVDEDIVTDSDYVLHGTSGGYEGLVAMADGSVTAFIESNGGGSSLADRGEPGQRVFKVKPDPLEFEEFLGYYPFDPSATAVADASALPNAPTKIAVIERNGYPRGNLVPGGIAPANRVCIIDLTIKDESNAFIKQCVLIPNPRSLRRRRRWPHDRRLHPGHLGAINRHRRQLHDRRDRYELPVHESIRHFCRRYTLLPTSYRYPVDDRLLQRPRL